MSEWRTIDSAPKDGTAIEVLIPKYSSKQRAVVSWRDGFLTDSGEDCSAWVWEQLSAEPPSSWTDGVCWERNEDNKQSTQPTHWRPLRSPPTP